MELTLDEQGTHTLFGNHDENLRMLEDEFGADQIDRIGVNNVLVETDYPHADSSFPDNCDILDDRLRHLAARDRTSILRGNAEKLFRFQPQMG